jgi:L-ascorbate metabolism protein UlaG (beta-lactamase superfamily)
VDEGIEQTGGAGSGGPAAARLVYVGHATVLIELDGVRLLTDPVLRSRVIHLRRRVPLAADALADVSVALVSHVHYDHFDRPSLRSLGAGASVVAPRGTRRLLRGIADVREVDVGDEVRFGDVTVRATHAEHGSARLMLRSTPALGYLVSGSRRVYFAGDTDLFEGMSAFAGSIDVALLPVAGWGSKVGAGHLDPERAARALQLLQPRLAVPIHWGTLSLPNRPVSAEPAEAFRRAAAELAPDVDVHVLEPGAELAF